MRVWYGRGACLSVSMLLVSCLVSAAPSQHTERKYHLGDAARGGQLVAVCVACHSTDGNSLVGNFPNLAGQGSRYLYKQLQDIQSGARPVPEMAGQLDTMSDQDLKDIAQFYAEGTGALGAADPALAALGETIYRSGITRKKIPACTACHSPTGRGNELAKYPALRGQWPEYTIAQLRKFRSGERTNDGDERTMRDTARDLNDAEIEAVAEYIRGLR